MESENDKLKVLILKIVYFNDRRKSKRFYIKALRRGRTP